MIVIDPRRTETAELADIHLAGPAGHRRLVPRRARRRARRRRTCSTDAWLAEHATGRRRGRRPPRRGRRRRLRRDRRRRRGAACGAAARRIAARVAASPSSRTSACRCRCTRRWSSYLEKLLWLLTGNFAKPGGQYVPDDASSTSPGRPSAAVGRRARSPVAGARIISGLVPVQRDRRGDPHRPPRPLPGDARRERQPGALARRQPAHARGARGRSTCSSSSTSR